MPTLEDAIKLAEYLHKNQVDKLGRPYIDHPKRVMNDIIAQGYAEWVGQAAVLHDVLEDCEVTINALLEMGYDQNVVRAVEALTRWPGLSNQEYYSNIQTNEVWRQIKLADIRDNTDPQRMNELPWQSRNRLKNKYATALNSLSSPWLHDTMPMC